MVKYLINWTQAWNGPGGSETRHSLLVKAFPGAIRVSVADMFPSRDPYACRHLVDDFLEENTTENDVVIKDAGVGGTRPVPARTVLMFGNPHHTMAKDIPCKEQSKRWRLLAEAQREDSWLSNINVANSNFSRHDAQWLGCRIDAVVPNGVDMDFWTPGHGLEGGKHLLWVGSKFKEDYSLFPLDGLCLLVVRVYKEANFSREDMLGIYRGAALLLHTFPVEGNNNTVLEAMACGLPVVTTRSGWFWDTDPSIVGACISLSTGVEDLNRIIEKILSKRDTISTRAYLYANGLSARHYVQRMREVVGCLAR